MLPTPYFPFFIIMDYLSQLSFNYNKELWLWVVEMGTPSELISNNKDEWNHHLSWCLSYIGVQIRMVRNRDCVLNVCSGLVCTPNGSRTFLYQLV